MFKRSSNKYGETPEPVTPYQKAAQVWDNRMGNALAHARNWRLVAFGSLGLSLLLSGGVIWQAGKSSVQPYVVELEANGSARAVRPATEAYQPSDAQIAFHLANFIEKVRSLPLDPIIIRQNWLQAYDFARGAAVNTLNEYAREEDPFGRIGKETVSVEITSIVRASPKSFQIRWLERHYQNGSLASTSNWTAIVSTAIDPPRDAKTLRKNPLGIHATSINWSPEIKNKQNNNAIGKSQERVPPSKP